MLVMVKLHCVLTGDTVVLGQWRLQDVAVRVLARERQFSTKIDPLDEGQGWGRCRIYHVRTFLIKFLKFF